MRAILVGIGWWLWLAAPATAAQFVFAFEGTVTEVVVHAEVGVRSVPVGAPVVGGYSYDINPNSAEQTINNLFWFATGTLARDIENLLLYPDGKVTSQFLFSPDARPDLAYVEFMSIDAAGRFDFRYTGRYGFLEFVAQVAVTDVSPVPVPGGMALLACGILGAIGLRRRAARSLLQQEMHRRHEAEAAEGPPGECTRCRHDVPHRCRFDAAGG